MMSESSYLEFKLPHTSPPLSSHSQYRISCLRLHKKMSDWSFKNTTFLAIITAGYIIGEIAHFLIATTSEDVANSVHYGDQACGARQEPEDSTLDCSSFSSEAACSASGHNGTCEWRYNGQGTDFQILVGPAFIYTFSAAALINGVALDTLNRPIIMGLGISLFSLSCILMGISNSFWQLVVLRMGIALGEAVCRPAASSLIAEMFG